MTLLTRACAQATKAPYADGASCPTPFLIFLLVSTRFTVALHLSVRDHSEEQTVLSLAAATNLCAWFNFLKNDGVARTGNCLYSLLDRSDVKSRYTTNQMRDVSHLFLLPIFGYTACFFGNLRCEMSNCATKVSASASSGRSSTLC